MDFIKFKIWSIQDKKFLPINVDSYILKWQGDCWLLCPFGKADKYWPFVRVDENENFKMVEYTGQRDVDGGEIYEGDILLLIDDLSMEYRPNTKIEVKWNGSDYDCFWFDPPSSFRIIGNIFENPELL
jgi:hypothetical protein